MPARLIPGTSYKALSDRLLKEIQEACRRDPLGAHWVVTPTSTLANWLRARLAEVAQRQVITGVRVLPLLQFMSLFPSLRGEAASRWSVSQDILLWEHLQTLPPHSPLHTLKRLPAGHAHLRETFLDLADGGFGPDQFEILEEFLLEPDLSELEREVLRLYSAWARELQARRIKWSPFLAQRLAEWIAEAGDAELDRVLAREQDRSLRVSLYGFYDFTDVTLQMIGALSNRLEVHLYLPHADTDQEFHPVFAFLRSLHQDLAAGPGSRLDRSEPALQPPEGSPTSFFLHSFPDGNIDNIPPFLTFQQASGLRSEVLAAAVQIRRWMDDDETAFQPHQILLAAPDPALYLQAIHEILPEFGIPYRLNNVQLELEAEHPSLLTLARIWEQQGAAEWIFEHVRSEAQRARVEGRTLPIDAGVVWDLFERKIRHAGIWGSKSWECLLDLPAEDDGRTLDSRLVRLTDPEVKLVRSILRTWVHQETTAEPEYSLSEAHDRLFDIGREWLGDTSAMSPLLEHFKQLGEASPNLRIPESLLIRALAEAAGKSTLSDPADKPGVLVTSFMRARGITPRGLVILGLESGRFPLPISEDPLLTDNSRRRLRRLFRDVGHRLALKDVSTEEMALLFYLLNTSAEEIHWVIPESDENGRAVTPTPWVQRYLHRWKNLLEQKERIPRAPAEQARWLLAQDPLEGSFLPPDLACFYQPSAAAKFGFMKPYAHLNEQMLLREHKLRWNGRVPQASFTDTLLPVKRVTVTGLEQLSRCPFRFFVAEIAGWEGLQPLESMTEPDALTWGGLLHGFLERLFKPAVESGRPLKEIVGELLKDNAGALTVQIEALDQALPVTLGILPPLFRRVLLRNLRKTVVGYLESLYRTATANRRVLELEGKYRRSFPNRSELTVSGQIDRIDDLAPGFVILDYKSGRTPENSKLKKEVRWGFRLQPSLYPWLYDPQAKSSGEVDFAFIFLKEPAPVEKTGMESPEAQTLLSSFSDILGSGLYLPTSNEVFDRFDWNAVQPCSFCEFPALCRRFDRGADQRLARLFRENAVTRFDWLCSRAGGDET